jgi:hypothetical protein
MIVLNSGCLENWCTVSDVKVLQVDLPHRTSKRRCHQPTFRLVPVESVICMSFA